VYKKEKDMSGGVGGKNMGARNQILFLIRLYFITLFLQASSVRFLRLLLAGWLLGLTSAMDASIRPDYVLPSCRNGCNRIGLYDAIYARSQMTAESFDWNFLSTLL
jgi:hypothetical protein